jgi:hypothetical protein
MPKEVHQEETFILHAIQDAKNAGIDFDFC